MSPTRMITTALAGGFALALTAGALTAATSYQTVPAPLAVNTARVTIDGNSNLHPYTASTTAVRLTRVQVAHDVAGPQFWDNLLKPGALEAFEISVLAMKLSSPKEGLDKNMHKALRTQEHPEITFTLVRLEPGAAPGAFRGVGILRVAGVEKEVVVDLAAKALNGAMSVTGEVQLLMPDFGIAPPKAMLGMLKTDPKVKVTFEVLLTMAI